MNIIGKINWFRGDSYPIKITISDSESGDPLDLTGYVFIFTVNSLEDPVDISTQMFSILGVVGSDPTTGSVSFTPAPENTNFPPGDYFYDIQMTTVDGFRRTIHKNTFIITQDISK